MAGPHPAREATMRRILILTAAAALLPVAAMSTPASGADGHCTNQDKIQVPNAERQRVDCLDDLSSTVLTATDHSDQSDWATLHSKFSRNPSRSEERRVGKECRSR